MKPYTDMLPKINLENKFQAFSIAIVIALLIGTITMAVFILSDKDSYTSIYIIPESIVRTSGNDAVIFSYGVQSMESGPMDYSLQILLNDEIIRTKQFSLKHGENLEEGEKLLLPSDATYPLKVRLLLTTERRSEEVHFWLQ
jgi:hypothetical protein